jgi:hypothetical protein
MDDRDCGGSINSMTMLILLIVNLTLPGISSHGDRLFYHDARSLALGGVSIILEYPSNPATMGFVDARQIFASGGLAIQNERRGLRVYDSFGNNIGIRTVTNNTSTNAGVGPSAIVIPLKMLRFGVQYAPIRDYNYYYQYEQRDDFYQLIRIDEQSHQGYAQAFSPMFSFKYAFINVGVAYSVIRGNWSQENRVIIPGIDDSLYTEEVQLNGNQAKIGVAIMPSLNLRLGYTYQVPYDLEDAGLSYPDVHALAIMYQPPGRIPTKFVGQVEIEMWDEEIVIYKVGVEHMIMGRYALRYGFCIFPDYEQRAIWTTNLTFGFGASIGRYFFDIGYGYAKRDYLNSDFQTFDVGVNYKFDETTHNLLISTGLSF